MKDLKGTVRRGKLAILFPLFALGLLVACADHHRVASRLVELDSLVDACPNSALAILDTLGNEGFDEFNHMYLELLRGKAMNKAYVKFTSDSAMLEVARYFDRHGDANQRMLAHYVLGCAYRDMGNAPRALECYQDAADIADTTSADCDHSTLMRVHGQMNELFMRLRMEKDALRESEIAQRLCWQMGDTLSALIFEEAICNHLYNTKQYEACIQKAFHLHQQYTEHGFLDEADAVYVFCVKSYLELQDYEKAKLYLDRFAKCRYFLTDPRKIKGGKGILYIYKAQYHLRVQNADSAAHYFQMALPYAHLNNNALLAYRGLFESYSMLHQADSALKYINLYSEQKERTYHKGNAETALQMENLYNYSSEQKMAEQQKQKAARWKKRALILALIVSLLCSLLFLSRYHNERRRRRISDLQLQLLYLQDEMQGEKDLMQDLLQEKQKMETTFSDKEDKANKSLEEKEQLIERQRHKIMELNEKLVDLHKTIDILQGKKTNSASLLQSPIVQKVFATVANPTNKLTESDWQELAERVEKYVPTFRHEMNKRKTLSEDEYRLCLLTLINVPPSSANELLDRDSTFATNTRKRLHKKIFGVEGSSTDFDRRLRQML